jgi:SAM-dependent methyltransferase
VRAVRADYDARAPRWLQVYEGSSFHDFVLQTRLRVALRLLADHGPARVDRALDVGCGAGQLLDARADTARSVVGVDVSWEQARSSLARLGGRDALIAQSDATRLPFQDAEFDSATALGLLEYLPSVSEGLAELARVTRSGGVIVVTAPNPIRVAYLLDPIGVVLGRLRRTRPGYRRQYRSARALRKELAAAGLDVLAIHGHGVGRFSFAGKPILSDAASVRLSRAVESALPQAILRVVGANLVAVARRR